VGAAQAFFSRDIDPVLPQEGPSIGFRFESGKNALQYWTRTSEGKVKSSKITFKRASELVGRVIQTGWKFDATVTILDFIPAAQSEVKYVESQIQYGPNAPSSAILVQAADAKKDENQVWLGLGEKATFYTQGKTKTIGYLPKRISLPFALQLNRFDIARYPGSANPMEFSSRVEVRASGESVPRGEIQISMNEPLKYGGYVFYQSSYIDAEPRPTISIFSVNQDPGRWLKYLGSFLICLGVVWLFLNRYRLRKAAGETAA
jgi:hypothetical protein